MLRRSAVTKHMPAKARCKQNQSEPEDSRAQCYTSAEQLDRDPKVLQVNYVQCLGVQGEQCRDQSQLVL